MRWEDDHGRDRASWERDEATDLFRGILWAGAGAVMLWAIPFAVIAWRWS